MPLPFAVAAGLYGVGSAGALYDGFFGGRKMDRRLQKEYDRVTDPSYGAAQFTRMAGQGPGLEALLSAQAARGGSAGMAQAQYRALDAERKSGAYDSYSRFRLGADAQAQGLLGMIYQNHSDGRQARQSLFDNFMTLGGGLMASGGGAPEAPPRPYESIYGSNYRVKPPALPKPASFAAPLPAYGGNYVPDHRF